MKPTKINITFVLPNLLPGGAERVFSYISQRIDQNMFNVTLLVTGYSKDASYDVENINVIFLEKPRVLYSIFSLFKYIIRTKPDIVITAVGHLNTIIAYMSLFFPKTRFISREVTVLSIDEEFFRTKKKVFNPIGYFVNKRFRLFDVIISQSKDMKDDIIENYNVDEEKIIVVNNPITDSFKLKKNTQKRNPVRYITVGRLSKEKGIDRVLKILSKVDIPFHYTLIGNGPEKEHIFSLIEKYKLEDKITYIDFTKEVSKYLSESDYFLQGSFFEGFPNCLIESCAVGTPVIAFNAPGGTKEIIENGVNGYIVESEELYLEKIQETKIWTPSLVRESVYKKFNEDLIIEQYENLFIRVHEKH